MTKDTTTAHSPLRRSPRKHTPSWQQRHSSPAKPLKIIHYDPSARNKRKMKNPSLKKVTENQTSAPASPVREAIPPPAQIIIIDVSPTPVRAVTPQPLATVRNHLLSDTAIQVNSFEVPESPVQQDIPGPIISASYHYTAADNSIERAQKNSVAQPIAHPPRYRAPTSSLPEELQGPTLNPDGTISPQFRAELDDFLINYANCYY